MIKKIKALVLLFLETMLGIRSENWKTSTNLTSEAVRRRIENISDYTLSDTTGKLRKVPTMSNYKLKLGKSNFYPFLPTGILNIDDVDTDKLVKFEIGYSGLGLQL